MLPLKNPNPYPGKRTQKKEMGKKEKLKAIRRVANELPPFTQKQKIKGQLVQVPVNHENKMKQLYIKGGLPLVSRYVAEVKLLETEQLKERSQKNE